jgi:hypothetical protein
VFVPPIHPSVHNGRVITVVKPLAPWNITVFWAFYETFFIEQAPFIFSSYCTLHTDSPIIVCLFSQGLTFPPFHSSLYPLVFYLLVWLGDSSVHGSALLLQYISIFNFLCTWGASYALYVHITVDSKLFCSRIHRSYTGVKASFKLGLTRVWVIPPFNPILTKLLSWL